MESINGTSPYESAVTIETISYENVNVNINIKK